MCVRVPEGDAGGAKGGSEREGVGSTRAWREREHVCVCMCVRACGCSCARERERESVCVCGCGCGCMRDKTIWGVAPHELGTDKQKGMAIEVDGK